MDFKRYILALIVTVGIFLSIFAISSYINTKKVENIKTDSDQISIDILSLETQFALLQEESSCGQFEGTLLSDELNSLGEKLSYAESQKGIDDEEVKQLKKYYSILQIRDFLLSKKIATQCKQQFSSILYFYTNTKDCSDCTKQGIVLSYLKEKYPKMRVYSFDLDLDLTVIKALENLYKIDADLPVVILDGKKYIGFTELEKIEEKLPKFVTASSSKTVK